MLMRNIDLQKGDGVGDVKHRCTRVRVRPQLQLFRLCRGLPRRDRQDEGHVLLLPRGERRPPVPRQHCRGPGKLPRGG